MKYLIVIVTALLMYCCFRFATAQKECNEMKVELKIFNNKKNIYSYAGVSDDSLTIVDEDDNYATYRVSVKCDSLDAFIKEHEEMMSHDIAVLY